MPELAERTIVRAFPHLPISLGAGEVERTYRQQIRGGKGGKEKSSGEDSGGFQALVIWRPEITRQADRRHLTYPNPAATLVRAACVALTPPPTGSRCPVR
jgi:hypothetical protein